MDWYSISHISLLLIEHLRGSANSVQPCTLMMGRYQSCTRILILTQTAPHTALPTPASHLVVGSLVNQTSRPTAESNTMPGSSLDLKEGALATLSIIIYANVKSVPGGPWISNTLQREII